MSLSERLGELQNAYGHLDGRELLEAFVGQFPGKVAVISSFGAEAVVLLDLVAQVDKALPVIFLDTDALFDETLDYQRQVSDQLGLTGVRVIRPDPADLKAAADLWEQDADRCCSLRKIIPLEKAVQGFEILVDGRKRFHGGGRETISTIEADAQGRVKVSPLARWDQDRIEAAFADRGLPRHPLVAQGYKSIGCWPCSRPVAPDEPVRAGRWAGAAKTECGIHRVVSTK